MNLNRSSGSCTLQKDMNNTLSEASDRSNGDPSSPEGSVGGVSSNEEDEVVERMKTVSDQEELIPIPPPIPKSGISILGHKLWIGNLDERLNE